jgi:quercetin dioxygenase-like cupin family protein
MNIEPRRGTPAKQTAQQEDTTTEFEAGAETRVHRRIQVTVERETVSFLIRRVVIEPSAASAEHSSAAESEQHERDLPATAKRNELDGGNL